MGPKARLAVPLSVLALVVASCGSSDGSSAGTHSVSPSATAVPGTDVVGTEVVGTEVTGTAVTGTTAADTPRMSGAPGRALEPTGMVLTGGSSSSTPAWPVTIDGAGNIWTGGPWQLTRLDTHGQATTWDAADDLAFASVSQLVASNGTGVWIVNEQGARLFDGTRFVADLDVPDDLMQILESPEALRLVRDVAEVGTELWVTIENEMPFTDDPGVEPEKGGRIVAFGDGGWRTVAELPGEMAGRMVVDATGVPWLMMFFNGPQAHAPAVRRWDGAGFVTPAADDPDFPDDAFEIVPAGDSGAVYVIGYVRGSGHRVERFDGTTWSIVATDDGSHIRDGMFGRGLAADSSGVWIASTGGITRLSTEGVWSDFGPNEGVEASETTMPAVAARGDTVVVRSGSGLHAFAKNGFESVWVDDAVQARVGLGLQAVSANEVWAGASRYADGAWTTPLGDAPLEGAFGVRARDGAMWFVLPDGVTRFADDEARTVAPDITSGSIVAGPDGSVWTATGGDVIGIGIDGQRTSIGHPDQHEVLCVLAGGPDGSVWVDAGCEESPVPILFRWDGSTWQGVDLPGDEVWLAGMTVTDDNTAWAAMVGDSPRDPNSGVARYADGAWQIYPGWPSGIVPATGDRVCSADDPNDWSTLHCYDSGGLSQTVQLPRMADVSIALDGSIWVGGEQIARLSQTIAAK